MIILIKKYLKKNSTENKPEFSCKLVPEEFNILSFSAVTSQITKHRKKEGKKKKESFVRLKTGSRFYEGCASSQVL